MHILLLSMPDYFEHMPPVAVLMPTGALSSPAMSMITTVLQLRI
jgi:hypothetical protein